jgi:hypothetical protein
LGRNLESPIDEKREEIDMKKNILIAILCVTILLLVPFTSISGASVGGLNTKVEIVEETNPVIPYYLFDELVVLINQLLVDGKDVPEVVDMCNEALEVIDSILLMELHQAICAALQLLFWSFMLGGIFLFTLAYIYRDAGQPEIASIFMALAFACVVMGSTCWVIGLILLCEWAWDILRENNILKNGMDLNPQINPESISEIDISAFTEFFKSYEVNCYPCMYE